MANPARRITMNNAKSPAFRWMLSWALALGGMLSLEGGSKAWSSPMINGGSIQPFRWAAGATINVYIQSDPRNGGRDGLIKEGIERWVSVLAERGLTLNVSIGNPPPNAVNPVSVTFKPDGFTSGGITLGEKNDALAGPTSVDKGAITSGAIYFRNDMALPTTDRQKDQTRNLGEHEMVHVLDLGDDPNGAVTNHNQTD